MLRRRHRMKAFCFKCKTLQEIKDPQKVVLRNGRRAVQGTCAACGKKVSAMATAG